MILTRENYHSQEANLAYMSRSQFNDFQECESKALAKIQGRWIEDISDALLVGQYVHTWNEGNGARESFIKSHPEMFTKQGELKAAFKVAEKMIGALENDPFCLYVLTGEKESIFTAEFAGAIWKVMVDSYHPERRRIVDLKTSRSLKEKVWNDEYGCKLSFVEEYKYPLQAALYCEIERLAKGRPEKDWFDFFMVAVSKEQVPDKEVIDLCDPERYAIELARVEELMPRVLAVKSGEAEPERCGCCDYCRSTKTLSGAVHYSKIAI